MKSKLILRPRNGEDHIFDLDADHDAFYRMAVRFNDKIFVYQGDNSLPRKNEVVLFELSSGSIYDLKVS